VIGTGVRKRRGGRSKGRKKMELMVGMEKKEGFEKFG